MHLILGTAQFGLHYGINNSKGKPSLKEIREILKIACLNKIKRIDTARSYGDCEEILGKFGYNNSIIITKLSPFYNFSKYTSRKTIETAVELSVHKSLKKLKVKKIHTLLLHRADHLNNYDGLIFKKLLEFKKQGKILNLGVSVQNKGELDKALNNKNINQIQMPFNILDYRWDKLISKIKKVKKKRKILIYVRSIFLQGLFFSRNKNKWKMAKEAFPERIWDWLENLSILTDRDTLIEQCISYIKGLNWVDGIVMGVDTKAQLLQNISAFKKARLNNSCISIIEKSRPICKKTTLDPSKWLKR